jgi:hypothetical protein
MTNTKFTELLNLYLDHEIGMEDAAALEAEIQQNPERREIYRQYCRMHKGCTELAANFAGAGSSVQPRELVSRLDNRTRSRFAAWTVGLGAAAAACFAVVLLTHESNSGNTPTLAQVTNTAPTLVAAAPVVYSLPPLKARGTEMHSVFTPNVLNAKSNTSAPRSLYANAEGDRFEWRDRVETTAGPDEEYGFQVRPTVPTGQRTYRSQRPIEGRVEMTAFQFQR